MMSFFFIIGTNISISSYLELKRNNQMNLRSHYYQFVEVLIPLIQIVTIEYISDISEILS